MNFLNKKGDFTVSEVTRIVLAVIILVALFGLSVKMYGVIQQRTHLQQAQEHIEKIGGLIEGMEEGDSEKYFLESPRGWYFLFFENPNSFFEGSRTSNNLEFVEIGNCQENCICICPKEFEEGTSEVGDSSFYRCKDGVCKNLDEFNLEKSGVSYGTFEIKPSELNFVKSEEGVEVGVVQ